MIAYGKSPSSRKNGLNAKIFIVSAPSGCGKTTLCNKLLEDEPALANSISMTTRKPRPGEISGRDYIFVSNKRFRDTIRRKGFLEYEENFGNFYGTPKKFVEGNLKKGVPVLLSIDVKGAMKAQRQYPHNSVLVFVLPPSIKTLKKRLCLRKSDTGEEIERRLSLAKKEMAYKTKYDYRIINDDLEGAYKKLRKIVVKELENQACQ